MPELPEVETIRRDLTKYILHKKIAAVIVHHPKTVRVAVQQFINALHGHKFTSISRRGKLLIFSLNQPGQYLLVHLKMTGQLIYHAGNFVIGGGHSAGEAPTAKPDRHTRVVIDFADRSQLFFHDMRLFGYMQLADEAEKHLALKRFGVEPLDRNFTAVALAKILRGRKTSLKAVLLNQMLIAGIGNIYADEACFAARVRLGRRSASLNSAEIKRLHQAIKRILQLAIRERGTTFNNYVDGAGHKGNFIAFLKVYGRAGEPCRRCQRPLSKTRVAGRGSVFCSTCQK